MRKNNRKGFTIVELVIVIAVIGILAGVMIPTISGVIADAKQAALEAEAKNIYTQYLANNAETLVDGATYYATIDGTDYYIADGVLGEKVAEDADLSKLTKLN